MSVSNSPPAPRHINTLHGAASAPKIHRFDYGAYRVAPIQGFTQHAAYALVAKKGMDDIDDLTGGPRPEHYEVQATTGKDGDTASTDIPYTIEYADGPPQRSSALVSSAA